MKGNPATKNCQVILNAWQSYDLSKSLRNCIYLGTESSSLYKL